LVLGLRLRTEAFSLSRHMTPGGSHAGLLTRTAT
jgi:hypothetical protein